MKYNDYIKKLSTRFLARLDEIDPQFNFDIGNEFEIHLGGLLQELLPNKYGICRGFVTPLDGQAKGDDIIIYDHQSYPNLKPNSASKFTIKENIPVDSVYAYLEAKNTIEIKKDSVGTYWGKAIKQTQDVKNIYREPRNSNEIIDGVTLGENLTIPLRKSFPEICNPMYTAIICRGIRENGKIITDHQEIKRKLIGLKYPNDNPPDLIIIGNDLAIFPSLIEPEKQTLESPFFIKGRHSLVTVIMPEMAFGFGMAMIQWALQNIKLKDINWKLVLGEVFEKNSHLNI